ncbi:outer membrane beta-barrel family protein [Croceitalea rosinachiae]|uniref:Outer membrane beta-barrel family protein n=1 Tax=Croceitalea rosinachiae TaxID=3075596 RepID=A0ABU3ABG9_9FLAO|nr:outer membrane beta-barrel family protein [Croceitalea sp. F388]MDT0607512.1 outer membrane beta-barrel family protein [Croceitalea sp. F388]
MKSYILFLVCCLASVELLFGQLVGSVVDVDGNPVSYANVMIYSHPDSALQTGVITNEDGFFVINYANQGTFMLRIDLLSFKTWNSEPFTISGTDFKKDFEKIILEEEVTSLQGVEVRGQRKLIQRTQEGSIINVQASVMTQGSTALQLLERSPGVILDQYNNTFSLNGKSGTLIMINGKAQRIPIADLIAMLNGMSANTIERIELLTNPSARYDVDGNAGIINIVMSKNETLGIRGNLNLSTGYGKGVKQTTGLSLNYGGERSTIFGSYTFSYDDTFSGFRGVGVSEIPVLGGNTAIDFTSRTQQINRNHNLNLGYEYQVSETSSFGASALFNQSRPLVMTQNLGLYDFIINPFLEAQIRLNGDGNLKNLTSSVYYEKTGEKNSFMITGDYINYNSQTPNEVNSFYFDENGDPFQPESEIYNNGNRGFNETDINVGVLKLDYEHTINEKASLEGGIKGSLSNTVNDARIEILEGDEFVPDDRFISTLENKETIGAAYALTDYSISEKLKVQLGLRYEYWDQDFDDNTLDRSFEKLFPSFFATHAFSDTTALNFAYNKRITRPNYSDLASFLIYNGPTSVFSGNPQLLPAITDNISLTYNNKSFSISLLAANENNPIARFQITRNPQSNLAVVAPVNMEYQRNIDVQTNVPIRVAHWWDINLNGTLGIRKFKLLHTDERITHDYIHYNFNGSQTMRLPANLSLEISGWYTSRHFNGSTRNEGFGILNVGVKKEFKNGSSLQFAVTDIFQSLDIGFKYGTLTREAFGDVFTGTYSPESGFSRIFRVSYTYPFGNKKVKEARGKTGADTEKSRL